MSSYREALPSQRSLYYGGAWHDAADGSTEDVQNPATGESLGLAAVAARADVDAAVAAAVSGYKAWREVRLSERVAIIREAAAIIRKNAERIALTDSADSGGPFSRMIRDATGGAETLEFFAGLATETKGNTIPFEFNGLNYSIQQPLGVIVRINAYNHPFLFCAQKAAAPLVTGNSVIIKPPVQAPLSSLLFAELVGGLFPPGVISVLPGGRECGEALVEHPKVAKVGLIGSVETGLDFTGWPGV